MTNEELLQKVLTLSINRMGKKIVDYETEIANLNAQLMILNEQIEKINSGDININDN